MGTVLALNAGSSSVKFAVIDERGDDHECLLRGQTRTREGRVWLSASNSSGQVLDADWLDDGSPETELLAWIETNHGNSPITAVGHRVVHGGTEFQRPVRIDADVLARLDALTPLAPLHQPAGLAPIHRLLETRPDLPQVACFDTAFHRTITSPASLLAIPRELHDRGLRKYGFHGLSYESIAAKLRKLDDDAERDRIIVAHLGNGASLCALSRLESIDTTMGFTALGGIMMGTRPGSLDPGVLLYLVQHEGFAADRLEHWLYHECGLLGVSGLSSDMTELLEATTDAAKDAVDLFCLSTAKGIASMATSLGGCDRIVFTGGIGENAAPVRERIVRHLAWMNVDLEGDLNRKNELVVSSRNSGLQVLVMATDEEGVIARHTFDDLNGSTYRDA